MKLIHQIAVKPSEIIPWDRAKNLFPLYTDGQFADFKEFLKAGKGEIRPVVLSPDFMLVDGYNRVQAAIQSGVEEIWADIYHYADEDEMERHAIVLNAKRRHLDSVVLARAASRYAELLKPTKAQISKQNAANRKKKRNTARTVSVKRPVSATEKAAKEVGVSEKTVRNVKKVDKSGNFTLIDAMENKDISIKEAAKLADKDESTVDQILAIMKQPKEKKVDTESHACLLAAACVDAQTRLRAAFEKLNIDNMTEKEAKDSLKMLGGIVVVATGYAEEIKSKQMNSQVG